MANEIRVPKGVSQEEIDNALKLLARVRESNEKRKAKLMDPSVKAQLVEKGRKARLRQKLLIAKALAAGISVTDGELG